MQNQLKPELLGLHSMFPFIMHDSASRGQMIGGHFSQRLVLDESDEPLIHTGVCQEFGKYTFSVKMPANGRVIRVIQRYPKGADVDSLQFSPETIVIFENDETKEIDYFSIPYHASYHQHFGFRYVVSDAVSKIRPGANIPKGTIFADTPAVAKNSSYKYGRRLNVALMSIPGVTEDGLVISEDVLEKLKFRVYETRSVEFGRTSFPLNLYGSTGKYKPFPDIGECIRDDGLLMMIRQYDDDLMPVELSVYDTIEPDFIFDKGVYVRGGVGRIVDVKVISNNAAIKQLPIQMTGHLSKYEKALLKFHKEIVDTEAELRRERKRKYGEAKLNLSPAFHRLVVDSLAIINYNEAKMKQSLELLYRHTPIDEYRVDFTIEYVITPNIGFKLTGCHGDKGVICKVEKPENMPVDAAGRRADVVAGAETSIGRMNLGRLFEYFFGSAITSVNEELHRALPLTGHLRPDRLLSTTAPADIAAAYNILLEYYSIVSERQFKYFSSEITEEEKIKHLCNVFNHGVETYYPIDRTENDVEVVKALQARYNPTYGPVTYIGESGNKVTTANNVRIAPMYLMLLDKTADEFSSISLGRLQHFGVLSPITRSEKFSSPVHASSVRSIGETEARIHVGYCGRECIAEEMDRSNNPITQRNIIWNIITADKPTNIEKIVDRNVIELGSNKPLQLLNHMTLAAGYKIVYEPEDESKWGR